MSRYSKEFTLPTGDHGLLCYGFDHALGYWYDIRDIDDDEDEGMLEENDSFSGMSNAEFIEVLQAHEIPQNHIDCVTMDVPF